MLFIIRIISLPSGLQSLSVYRKLVNLILCQSLEFSATKCGQRVAIGFSHHMCLKWDLLIRACTSQKVVRGDVEVIGNCLQNINGWNDALVSFILTNA